MQRLGNFLHTTFGHTGAKGKIKKEGDGDPHTVVAVYESCEQSLYNHAHVQQLTPLS